jgi:thiamine pyrophosphate-dependent acetolactate synthase large subunit-like protein
MTGAGLLVNGLEAPGVECIFGVSGAKIDTVYDTRPDCRLQTVVCRHGIDFTLRGPPFVK